MKIDVGSSTDSQEAAVLGHKNDYIMIYSNSWGPSDFGFIVEGPDVYTKTTLVSITFVNYLIIYTTVHVHTTTRSP